MNQNTSSTRRSRARRGLAIGLLSLSIVAPSGSVVVVGAPFRHWPDLIALVLIVALLPMIKGPRGRVLWIVFCVGFLGVLGLKGLSVARDEGAVACFQAARATDVSGRCEFSYDQPHRRITRHDRTIAFGTPEPTQNIIQTNWELAFLNTLGYNVFGQPESEDPRRPRFSVRWSSVGELPPGTLIEFTGSLEVRDGGRVVLQAASSSPTRRELQAGVRDARIDFAFYEVIPQNAPPKPYAYLRLVGPGASGPLEVGRRPSWLYWLAVHGLLVAMVLIASGRSLQDMRLQLDRELARRGLALIAPAIVVLAVSALTIEVQQGGSFRAPPPVPIWLPTLAFASLLLLVPLASSATALRLASLVLLWPCFERMKEATPFGRVAYRNPGDDPLAYQAFAREIWIDRSPRAGEDVYFFQPGGRYLFSAMKLIIGEDDRLLPAIILWVGLVGLIWLGRRIMLHSGRRFSPATIVGLLLSAEMLQQMYGNIASGLIEGFAWAAMPWAIGLIVLPKARSPLLGLLLLGLASFMRVNQIPGTILVCVVLFFVVARLPWRRALAYTALANWSVVLLLAHNLYYGGTLRLLKVHDLTKAVFPSELPHVFTDADVRSRVAKQLFDVLYLSPSDPLSPGGAIVFYGSFVFIVTTVGTLIHRVLMARRAGLGPGVHVRALILVVTVPIAFLAIYVSFKANIYYPRHLVIAYLTGVLVSVLALERLLFVEQARMSLSTNESRRASLTSSS